MLCIGIRRPFSPGAVHLGLKRVEMVLPATGPLELREPVRELGKRRGIKAVHTLPAAGFIAHDTAFPEHAKMPADRWAADVEMPRDLPRRPVAPAQQNKNLPAHGISDRGSNIHPKRVTEQLRIFQGTR